MTLDSQNSEKAKLNYMLWNQNILMVTTLQKITNLGLYFQSDCHLKYCLCRCPAIDSLIHELEVILGILIYTAHTF